MRHALSYTPRPLFAVTGGADTFTVRVTNTAPTLQNLFGLLPGSATTVTVPVKVVPPGTVDRDTLAATASSSTDSDQFNVINTGYQSIQIAGYTVNQATLSPAVGTVIAPAGQVGNSAVFVVPSGQVTVGLNPAGVNHYGQVQALPIDTPTSLAISPDGRYLYIGQNMFDYTDYQRGGGVSVLDTQTNLVVATIPVGSPPPMPYLFGGAPWALAISTDGKKLYTANTFDNSVSTIDTTDNTVTATVGGLTAPSALVVSPDGGRVYVASGDGIAVLDTVSESVVGALTSTPGASWLAVSPDGATLYATMYNSNTVSAISTTTGAVLATIPVGTGPYRVAVSPDGSLVYVANVNANTVSVIQAATNTVSATIAVSGTYPQSLGVSSDGSRLYVANQGTSTVSVIDTATNNVVSTMPLSVTSPAALVVSPDGNWVYTADMSNTYTGAISELNTKLAGSDGGSFYYTVTFTAAGASCSSSHGVECGGSGTDAYLEDAPGTIVVVGADNAQQQSDYLGDLCVEGATNCIFTYHSPQYTGYSNPVLPNGFTPYVNLTTSPSTDTYLVSTTETQTSSWQYAVNVSGKTSAKLGDLGAEVSSSYTETTGKTLAEAATYSQSTTQTVQPGEELFLYTETPVYRFYGDWQILYGNTTYVLKDVWFDSPDTMSGAHAVLVAYTCEVGSAKCAELSAGNLPTPSGLPEPIYVTDPPQASSTSASAATRSKPAMSGEFDRG